MNINKLTTELQQASLPCIGVSATEEGGDEASLKTNGVRIDFSRPLTTDELTLADEIIANHTSTWLSPRVQTIMADGQDIGIIHISGDPGVDVLIDILAGESPSQETVALDDAGLGELQVTCVVPGTRILITADGQSVVIQAV